LTAGASTAYRYTRQVRLAEVGEEGQARLFAAVVGLSCTGLAARVEARYLRGAGVGVDDTLAAGDATAPAWLEGLSPGAREVAAGAHAALGAVRGILRGDSAGR
jgi:hypothetical protein